MRRQVPWLGPLLAAFLLATFLLAAGVPVEARGQNTGVEGLINRGRTAGMDLAQMQAVAKRAGQMGLGRKETASLLRPAVGLAEEGLPAGPILGKALEGLAKQVPHSRISSVLRRQRRFTEQAGQVVGQWSPDQEGSPTENKSGLPKSARERLVTATAEALREGATAGDIESFLTGLPEKAKRPGSAQQVAVATRVLGKLLGGGASSKVTRELLSSAIKAGYHSESLRQLPQALQRARQQNERPVAALAEEATRAILRGAPAARVLQGSFPGGFPSTGLPADGGHIGATPGIGKSPGTEPPGDPGTPTSPPTGGGSDGGPS